MQRFLDRIAIALAVGFGMGLIRRAPGTWGSLLGFPLGAVIYGVATHFYPANPPLLAQLSAFAWVLLIATFLGLIGLAYLIIDRTESAWKTHDDSRIVIDEVVGQAMCVSMFQPSIGTYAVAFLLFRLFDISKPGLIGWADRRLPGAWGTLLDDIIAGFVVAVILIGCYEVFAFSMQ